MKRLTSFFLFPMLILFTCTLAFADKYSDTKKMFVEAGVGDKFESAYGYALFPTIGKAGFVVGGAYGEGQVYKHGALIGATTMTQATIGFQLGGSGFSQVIFFQDERAFNEFTKGNFEFGTEVQAVALTAAVGAAASTKGSAAVASGGKNNAEIASGGYYKGMATYTITKGGLMYEASVGGQKFTFTRK